MLWRCSGSACFLDARMVAMTRKRLKPGDPGYRHPDVKYETDPLWPLIEKGIGDLVNNQDLIEQEDRNYIVGYLCKVILNGQKIAKKSLLVRAR
jgi:hypothetical protein